MTEEEKKLIESAKKAQIRHKKQNEKIKENYDRISITLPKGTKKRITDAGQTMNGLVNALVLEWLADQKKKEK